MAKRKKIESKPLELNMTSMLDIVFQLIIFFILVTNFAAADLPKLEPPKPLKFNRERVDDPTVRLVNVVPILNATGENKGKADHVLFAGQRYAPVAADSPALEALTAKLKDQREKMKAERNLDLKVDLRADRGLHFDQVQPVMQAITNAGIARINLVARRDTDN